ncbi:MAG: FdhF/YdeP family oxidoreductase [Phycisphaerales bacterium]|nr:FdhF/YdeP family oxidoreductase [Phycisphaerae bacterium]NNM25290.1 FdhF/YdeP family oxidoreductase [Phycisphaerales bacterium]
MRKFTAGGGWPAIWYTLKKGREAGGVFRLYRALRSKNACKTCALGMGGQRGGMVNERGRPLEVCKKSIQAMAADMAGRLNDHFADDFSIEQLRRFTPRELEQAGRLTVPLHKGPLDDRYRPVSWEQAIDGVAGALAAASPDERFFYFSGRSSNEAGFLLQLFARISGTNNVNNCSYYCHQASGVGLTSVTGSGTATVVLEDVEQCDLLLLIGANPSSNHPRLMKTIVELRRRGGKVIVINPLREVGLERFRVPSDVRSLLFGSRTCDLYVQPNIGGDIALLAGVARVLLERGDTADAFIHDATEGWDAFSAHVRGLDWSDITRAAGVDRATIEQIADIYARSERTIFCWAMGLTHHAHGVENVQAVANLALMRGMLGRPGRGLLPLRGHSNVQGIGSVGVTPQLKQAIFDGIERSFDVTLPTTPGLDTLRCMEQAHDGRMRFACCLGGNLYGSNPDAAYAAEAMNRIGTVVYLSTTLNTGHAWGTGRDTYILPVRARDEEDQATTQESMFNYVRLSAGGPPRYEGPRSEVEVIASIAEAWQARVGGPPPLDWTSMRAHDRIREAIAKVVPGYEAIGRIDATKEEFQIAGRTFHEPRFPTDNGRAKFHVVNLPAFAAETPKTLRLMTMRSEGQFNTVVYEEEDIYRGQERRDVILMNDADIERMDLAIDGPVTVCSETGTIAGVRVRAHDIPAGNAAMYYPEANTLVPRTADTKSGTPAFKNVRVWLE